MLKKGAFSFPDVGVSYPFEKKLPWSDALCSYAGQVVAKRSYATCSAIDYFLMDEEQDVQRFNDCVEESAV